MTLDLKVCPRCGWYQPNYLPHECEPIRGVAADSLLTTVGLPGTKLGYGHHCVTVYLDGTEPTGDRIPPHLVMEVHDDGSFTIRDLWTTDSFGGESMVKIIKALQSSPIGNGGVPASRRPRKKSK